VEERGEVALAPLARRLELLAHEVVVDRATRRKTPSGTAPSVSYVIRESANARLACAWPAS
jgi:hypothetical protein